MQDSRWHQVEDGLLSLNNQSVPRVIAPLKAGYDIHFTRVNVNNLSFSFIAPLGPDDYYICHGLSSPYYKFRVKRSSH